MDRDIEQAADAGGPTRPWGAMKEWTQAQRDTAAAAGQVPAEAVEAFYAAYGPAMEAKYNEDGSAASSVWHNAGVIAGLAAAAPLIVAAQQRATPAVVAALDEASHTIANLRAEVDRLTAERIALADKIEAAAEASFEDSQWIGGMYQAASMVRTPGGPR